MSCRVSGITPIIWALIICTFRQEKLFLKKVFQKWGSSIPSRFEPLGRGAYVVEGVEGSPFQNNCQKICLFSFLNILYYH